MKDYFATLARYRAAAPGRPKQGPTLVPDRPELVEGSPYSANGVPT